MENCVFDPKEITRKEIDRFNQDGFIIFDRFLDSREVALALTRVEPVFSGTFETGVLPDKVKWQKGRDPEGVPRSLCNVWKGDRTLARILLAEEVGRVCGKLMEWPGARCNQDSILWVPPGAGTVCCHQDNSYQDWHQPGGIATCWIALSNTSHTGGTLEYAKGSHKWPTSARVNTFATPSNYREELDAAAKRANREVELVSVTVPAGGAAFHHGNLWHGSNYNRSTEPRYTVATHCMTSESTFHPSIPSPMFSHYKRFGNVTMDESFFPILWTADGKRSKFLDDYLHPAQSHSKAA